MGADMPTDCSKLVQGFGNLTHIYLFHVKSRAAVSDGSASPEYPHIVHSLVSIITMTLKEQQTLRLAFRRMSCWFTS